MTGAGGEDEGACSFRVAVDVVDGQEDDLMPRRLWLGERGIQVAEVLDRWPGADHLYVKLRGGDGALYILRLDTSSGIWQMIQFIREGAAQA
ncbi:MAG TPA: hypothetical protein VHL31_05870 [Geminicoccus sp.]|jgi:hypothetical protein|uniref:hypothetical protein n=1 Tax=Geminicoccus sp. TaxID=2024832 RepID=UPI002E32FAB3|nr:hypothetical protein [Geminicoccus sp.]HEX2525816.1 hypothetical protein [Geminicoccus sp.]